MSKKVWIIALVVVIVALAAFTIVRISGPGDRLGKGGPDTANVACVDCGPMEVSVRSMYGADTDEQTGYYKCPKCGKFTLGGQVTCSSCGEIVASAPKEYEDPPERMYEYPCPKCGDQVYAPAE